MPSSTWVHTSTVGDIINRQKPESVLDIGVGFGRWGFTAREIMDVFRGRVSKKDWRTKIVGIEAYPKYITSWHREIYDNIIIINAIDYIRLHHKKEKYDLIIMGDVLEHFEKKEALELLGMCREMAKEVVVCIPIGSGYPQGEALGNRFEAHLSTWEYEEFEKLGASNMVRCTERIKKRPYGVIEFF